MGSENDMMGWLNLKYDIELKLCAVLLDLYLVDSVWWCEHPMHGHLSVSEALKRGYENGSDNQTEREAQG